MLTAVDVVDQSNPDYMILVGIGYGLREDEQTLGDVMVSTELKAMGPKKVLDRVEASDWPVVELRRGGRVPASVTLLDRFRSGSRDWSGARRHFGLILSQHVLVNSKPYIERLRKIEPDAIGGEMEGAGVYCTGHKRKIDWIVVKSICDWGYDKDDTMQARAAANTAAFVIHVLGQGGLAAPPGRAVT